LESIYGNETTKLFGSLDDFLAETEDKLNEAAQLYLTTSEK